MKLLEGKRALVTGVANRWSIASGIARRLHEHGASIALTYQGERVKDEVEKLGEELGGAPSFECDVSNDASLAAMRDALAAGFGSLDGLVHSIAFANKEDLAGKVFDTSRGGFALALDVSSYSLIALVSALRESFNDGASVMALTYLRRHADRSELQLDGHRQSGARVDGALPGLRPGRSRHSRQRHLGRPDQDRQLAPSRRVLDAFSTSCPKVAPLRRNVRPKTSETWRSFSPRISRGDDGRRPLRGCRISHDGTLSRRREPGVSDRQDPDRQPRRDRRSHNSHGARNGNRYRCRLLRRRSRSAPRRTRRRSVPPRPGAAVAELSLDGETARGRPAYRRRGGSSRLRILRRERRVRAPGHRSRTGLDRAARRGDRSDGRKASRAARHAGRGRARRSRRRASDRRRRASARCRASVTDFRWRSKRPPAAEARVCSVARSERRTRIRV